MNTSSLKTYRVMDYISTTLWHFIRSSADESSLDIFLDKILNDDGGGCIKHNFRNEKLGHKRVISFASIDNVSSSSDNSRSLPDTSGERTLYEPRCVCFADIPLNFLPIHLQKYNGVGIGFKRTVLEQVEQLLRPVWYIPRVYEAQLKEYLKDGSTDELKKYVKLPSENSGDDELFESIYREREWRIPEDFNFSMEHVSSLIFQNKHDLKKAINNKKMKELLNNGVSILTFEDHFEEKLQ